MSVFSIMKKARKAKEQTAKQVGKQKDETPPTKYRHVPTHAASDALLGAPAGWIRDDAERIRQSNKKRLAMSASEDRLPQSPSLNSLSPMHVDVHANTSRRHSTIVGQSGSSSSASSVRGAHWAQTRNNQYRKSSPPSSTSSGMHMSASFNSLDAELYRARVPPAQDSNESYVPRHVPPASMPPSLSSSLFTTPLSSPSTSPSTYSTPSFGPSRYPKIKVGAGLGYSGDGYEQYGSHDSEAFEMRVLRQSASKSKMGGNYGLSNTHTMSDQQGVPIVSTESREQSSHDTTSDRALRPPHPRLAPGRALIPATFSAVRNSIIIRTAA